MDLTKVLEFRGTWRTYQARVLKNADKYMEDGKVHIVAAPGSGKTTLGIELIRRNSMVTLILAPSITIREQWVSRMEEAFLKDGLSITDYVSQDLRAPKTITVVTYQSLHSAMNKYKGVLDESGVTANSLESDDRLYVEKEEEVDYSGFDLVATMKKAGLKLICLDECHHLRNEWWKALEEFKEAVKTEKLIALTATPPYDSTPALWKRYMDMCGEIDEEITVPELVREGSLCPHQDYVYLNYPTEEEIQEIEKFKVRSKQVQDFLLSDENFVKALMTHKGLRGLFSEEELLAEGDYLIALLVFLQDKGIAFPQSIQATCKIRQVPPLTETWLEQLVQGFLYDDADAYEVTKEYREWLTNELKTAGLIEKKKVAFVASESVQKLLTNSKGKCKSIRDIVMSEYQNIGPELRMLILTDFIRKEYEKTIGVPEADINALGVLPFFEQLRREGTIIKLGVLCGTIVIIPASAKEALLTAIGNSGKVTFGPIGALPEDEYVKVTAVGDNHFLTSAVTDIFTQGHMQVLIGTKSLLGEGWDSPCINSLILASFVGSYMLSNQMRGRAIRVFKGNPNKTSNIWHLVCMMPEIAGSVARTAKEEESADYNLLCRRMDNFLGLHYTEERIQSGMERLSILQGPYTKESVARIDEEMLAMSRERESLLERWKTALVDAKKMEVMDVTEVTGDPVSQTMKKKGLRDLALAGVGTVAGLVLAMVVPALGLPLAGFSVAAGAVKLPKYKKVESPEKRVQAVGEGIYHALCQMQLIEEPGGKILVETKGKDRQSIFLNSGTGHDKLLFAKCVQEFLSAVNDQRYLLVKANRHQEDSFYCVPDCFAKRKEDVETFYHFVAPYIGPYDLVYTRSEKGRAILLEGRMKAVQDAKEKAIAMKAYRNNR